MGSTLTLGLVVGIAHGESTLRSGPLTLELGSKSSLTLATSRVTLRPIVISLLATDGVITPLAGGYATTTANKDGVTLATTELRADDGTTLAFHDRYTAETSGEFILRREVTVRPGDAATRKFVGFQTRFIASPDNGPPLQAAELFIPGISYGHNERALPRAVTADPRADLALVREDRMALPLASLYDPAQHVALTISHLDADPTTTVLDRSRDTLNDARVQVGSLGVVDGATHASLAFCFPGTEADRTYFRGRNTGQRGTFDPHAAAERFHPISNTATQTYSLSLALSAPADSRVAQRDAWRAAYDAQHITPATTDLRAAFDASIALIAHETRTYGTTPNSPTGLPFALHLPAGNLTTENDINFQMGFVGQQLPLARHLIRYGRLTHRPDLTAKGAAIVDFWAANCMTPPGLPHTWFDVHPKPHWRKYETFLRVATDGMNGALQAWNEMRKAGTEKPEWLAFCRKFGDWLVTEQAREGPDAGTWCRSYNPDTDKPVQESRYNTTHPLRFLVDLYLATGDERYRTAALSAGEWSLKNIDAPACYIGGTADNPNVMDKEAGFLAIEAFEALHDLTADPRYLAAAQHAADYTETWMYAWNLPPVTDDPRVQVPPAIKSTRGLSLIATGHSGTDLYLAIAPFAYERLAIATHDSHYAQVAQLLLHDTKQWIDVKGSLNYGQPGLCTEALSLAPQRGHGVNVWLPWVTFSQIEPMAELEDAYGTMDVSSQPPDRLKSQNAAYAKTRGFSVK